MCEGLKWPTSVLSQIRAQQHNMPEQQQLQTAVTDGKLEN